MAQQIWIHLFVLLLVLATTVTADDGLLFRCGFETTCDALQAAQDSETAWSYTDGAHAPSNHYPQADHTYGNASGWYMFTDKYSQWRPVTLTTVQNPYYPEKFNFSFAYALSGVTYPNLIVKLYHTVSVYTAIWDSNSEGNDTSLPPKWFVKTLSLPADIYAVRLETTFVDKDNVQVVAVDDVSVSRDGGSHAAPATIFNCSFEAGLCGLQQGEYSTQNWLLTQGMKHVESTPKVDVTLGTEEGHYVFAGADGKNSTAFLDLPEVQIPDSGRHCVEFSVWFSNLLPSQEWIKFYLLNISDPFNSSIISQSNHFGRGSWVLVSLPLRPGALKLRFGISDIGYLTNAALDEIRVRQCPIAEYRPNKVFEIVEHLNCSFEQDVCGIETNVTWRSEQTYTWARVKAGSKNAPAADRFGNAEAHFLVPNMTIPITLGQAADLRSPNVMASAYCAEFWLYMHGADNARTSIAANVGGSIAGQVWAGGDSDRGSGWHRVFFALYNGQVQLYIFTNSATYVPLSIAIDDLRIDHCLAFLPPTTTSTSSTTSATTSSTTTSQTSSTTKTTSTKPATQTTPATPAVITATAIIPTTSVDGSTTPHTPAPATSHTEPSFMTLAIFKLVSCLIISTASYSFMM